VLDLEPERHPERAGGFFDEVRDEPRGTGDQHDTAHRFGWHTDVDERRAAGTGTVDREVATGAALVCVGDAFE
jgi:hypothetical protein